MGTLGQAIQNFKGAVIILSHSKHKDAFQAVSAETWSIRGGRVHAESCPVSPGKGAAKSTREADRQAVEKSIQEVERRLREASSNKPLSQSEMQDLLLQLQRLKADLTK